MTPENIYRIWQAEVARWHHNTDFRLRNGGDTIQAHMCRVAQLGWMIFADEWTRDDFAEAVLHDVPESWTGDPSYEAKQREIIKAAHDWAEADIALRLDLPEMKSPRVKLCDGIDCILFAASRAPDLMHRKDWQEHRIAVLKLASELGQFVLVREIMEKGVAL